MQFVALHHKMVKINMGVSCSVFNFVEQHVSIFVTAFVTDLGLCLPLVLLCVHSRLELKATPSQSSNNISLKTRMKFSIYEWPVNTLKIISLGNQFNVFTSFLLSSVILVILYYILLYIFFYYLLTFLVEYSLYRIVFYQLLNNDLITVILLYVLYCLFIKNQHIGIRCQMQDQQVCISWWLKVGTLYAMVAGNPYTIHAVSSMTQVFLNGFTALLCLFLWHNDNGGMGNDGMDSTTTREAYLIL